MDWNLFRRNTQHRFLRKELVYKDHIWVRLLCLNKSNKSPINENSDSSITLQCLQTFYYDFPGLFICRPRATFASKDTSLLSLRLSDECNGM